MPQNMRERLKLKIMVLISQWLAFELSLSLDLPQCNELVVTTRSDHSMNRIILAYIRVAQVTQSERENGKEEVMEGFIDNVLKAIARAS